MWRAFVRWFALAAGLLGCGDNVTTQLDAALDATPPPRLASLELSYAGATLPNQLSPSFHPLIADYTVQVGVWLEQVQVSATPSIDGATISVNGIVLSAGGASQPIDLAVGSTPVVVRVQGPGGASEYSLDIVRAANAQQEAYVKSSATMPGDAFGYAVALHRDTLAVAAPGDDTVALSSGAVYVFRRVNGVWATDGILIASNAGETDQLGGSNLALFGDTLAVAAPYEDGLDNDVTDRGSIYVFGRTDQGWSQQAYLEVSGTTFQNQVGRVALWNDTLVIGAPNNNGAGVVFVFRRTGTTWTQEAYLRASNPQIDDDFGSDVSLWGDTLVASAPYESSAATGINGDETDNTAPLSGAVYVFTRTGTEWTQQAYIKASNTEAGDRFGLSVSLSGDTLAVAAPFEDSPATGVSGDQGSTADLNSGAVYVFTRDGTEWSQHAYIKPSDTDQGDNFGQSLGLWGNALLVGSFGEDSSSTGIDGSQTDSAAGLNSGAAYLFVRRDGLWSQASYVKASNTDAADRFGGSVGLWGDTAVVAAPLEDSAATGVNGDQSDNTVSDAGASYVFR